MNAQQRQICSSILAIVLCIVFLWTGKKFIWNTEPETVMPDEPPISEESFPAYDYTMPTESTGSGTSGSTAGSTSTSASDSTGADVTADSGTDSISDTTGTQTDAASSASASGSTTTVSTTTVSLSTSASTSTVSTASATQTTPALSTESQCPAPDGYFSDALFIGDSRTVGIANYGPIDGAQYFATVGLATYKVNSATNEVGSMKGQNFAAVLSAKQYGKVYIMLGINEIGNDRNTTIKRYQELIEQIRTAQPNAVIYIQANLRVTAARSAKDSVINNTNINAFNAALYTLAQNVSAHYLDVNPLFDDGSGNFGADYTHDGVHPLAKYYRSWSEWIQQHVIL